MRSWWRRRGLRTRLVAGSVVPLTAALVVGTLALTAIFASGRLHEVDAQTQREAAALVPLAGTAQLPAPLPVPVGSTLLAQVVSGDGRVMASSASASPLLPLLVPRSAGVLTVERPDFGEVPLRIRVVRATVAGKPAWVVVAAPLGDVRRAVRALRLVLLVVVPALVVGATLLAFLLVGWALRPFERLRLQQQAFVADAAHELRSPLASMRVQLDVALRHPEVVDATGLAGELAPEVERLAELVDDLLLLARLEAGAGAPYEPVDLTELAGVEGPPVVVLGDRAALGRVVRNLRDNAARHGQRVEVTVSADGASAVLDVDDDGPGVPPAYRDRVFQRWFRLDDARDRATGGSGLGLALVREICAAHGGTVEVMDSPLGGARLRVRLPLAGAE